MNRKEVIDALRKVIAHLEVPEEAPHKKGYDFERRFSLMCEHRGLACLRAGKGQYDFFVNDMRVQCKKLSPHKGKIIVSPGNGSNYPPGSFDVLVVELEEDICIVPASDISTTSKGMMQASFSVGFLKKYADAWWVLERSVCPVPFEKQLMLIEEEATDGR